MKQVSRIGTKVKFTSTEQILKDYTLAAEDPKQPDVLLAYSFG